MDLLPKSHSEFTSPEYWDKFFKKRGKQAFEWYGEYNELCAILHRYIKPADNILVIGCGNSKLSADLYDVGYYNIVNIDISDMVISQMNNLHAQTRPKMKYLKMDVTKLEFADNEFSVVLDKGTLDALMPDGEEAAMATVEAMFKQIDRVLRIGGRYLCVTLAQPHILDKVLGYFTDMGWMARVCRTPDRDEEEDGKSDFHLPVFVILFTKFKKMPNMKQILETCYFEDQVERKDSLELLKQSVREMQQYGIIRQRLGNKSHAGEAISLDLHCAGKTTPRYTLHVVDSARRLPNKFAIFIVPEGRETEWLFATDEGRQELLKNAGFERLLVVTLHRDHEYGSLDDVKTELSSKVMELAPPTLGKRQVPFLSLGDDINTRTVKQRGQSELSGSYVIEDVDSGGVIYRRLIFLSNPNVVQSEVRLVKVAKKKGGKKKASAPCLTPDTSRLSIGYYKYVIAGLAFLEDFQQLFDTSIRVLLVGLGGGSLPMFMHNHFPKVELDIVELDPAVVKVATDWFGFQQSERMRVHVADGLDFLRENSQKGEKYHVIILDVDSKDVSVGMSCPPQSFMQPDILQAIDCSLHQQGVLVLNLVCRNKMLRQTVLKDLKSVFSHMYCQQTAEDVNETVYAFPAARRQALEPAPTSTPQSKSSQGAQSASAAIETPSELFINPLPKTLSAALRTLQEVIRGKQPATTSDIPRLSTLLDKLQLC